MAPETEVHYGVDCGDKKFWVSVNGQLGVSYSVQDFIDLKWYQGPGKLATETTTFYCRPVTKTASLSQFLTYEQACEFEENCKQAGVDLFVYPNKSTWMIVQDFLRLLKAEEPRVAKYSHIDPYAYKANKKGKVKNDSFEAVVLGWTLDFCPQTLTKAKFRDPDSTWDWRLQLKHELIGDTNRRLNNQRITNLYDDPDFINLRNLFSQIEEEVKTSNHPGAKVLRDLEITPFEKAGKRSDIWGYKKGDIKLHEISPIFKAVYACRCDEDGRLRPLGFSMLWQLLGGNAFRFRSGVAGAQLRYNFAKKVFDHKMTESGLKLPCKNDSFHLTRDKESPYYQARKESHKDVKNAVKFLNQTYEKLLK